MNYTKAVSEKLDIVNEVADEINVPYLLVNPDFSVDEMSVGYWLKINLNDNGQNKIPLSLTFTQSGLEIGLDRIAEAIDWSNKDFEESPLAVKTMLKSILTSHMLVEYYGSFRTEIRLFDRHGKCTNKLKYYEVFILLGKREDRLYYPIY